MHHWPFGADFYIAPVRLPERTFSIHLLFFLGCIASVPFLARITYMSTHGSDLRASRERQMMHLTTADYALTRCTVDCSSGESRA